MLRKKALEMVNNFYIEEDTGFIGFKEGDEEYDDDMEMVNKVSELSVWCFKHNIEVSSVKRITRVLVKNVMANIDTPNELIEVEVSVEFVGMQVKDKNYLTLIKLAWG